MSKQRQIFRPILILALILSGTLAISFSRSPANSGKQPHQPISTGSTTTTGHMHMAQTQEGPRPSRNFAMQSEALKLGRKMGPRFISSRHEASIMAGHLITETERQPLQVIRRQSDRGEHVEISLSSKPQPLTWTEAEGARSSGNQSSGLERALIERLALDSVDQFVFAQLRGASYYTIARNVRPAEAGDADDYSGPLWTIVRVDDPDRDTERKPQSRWRLYYINSTTGLIDRIVSEVDGERVEAIFSGWLTHGDDAVPAQVVWTRNGLTIMEFKIDSFVVSDAN